MTTHVSAKQAPTPTIIDGAQYCNWDREIFLQLISGGVTAIHATVAYHETARETLSRLGEWSRRFTAFPDLIRPVDTVSDIETAKSEGRLAVFFGAQNPSIIEDDIDLVFLFRRLGIRIMQLTYNTQSLLGSGWTEPTDGGLTRFGRKVVQEMNRVAMLIDLAHAGERTILDAAEHSRCPIVVSHANPRKFLDTPRNLTDRAMAAVARTGGLLGLSAYPNHLANGSQTTLGEFCDMVAYAVDVMGPAHVAIGTDLCHKQPDTVLRWMRSGRWSPPADPNSASDVRWPVPLSWFKDGSDFQNFRRGLESHGFDRKTVHGILGENWLRVLKTTDFPDSRILDSSSLSVEKAMRDLISPSITPDRSKNNSI